MVPSVFGRLFSVFGRLQNPVLLVLSSKTNRVRLVSDGAICLEDSFEFTIYHCMKLKALRHEFMSKLKLQLHDSIETR